jgi:hypothetical protein
VCPACIATATQIAAGATSIGAFARYVVRKLRAKIGTKLRCATKIIRTTDHEQEPNTNSEIRFTT